MAMTGNEPFGAVSLIGDHLKRPINAEFGPANFAFFFSRFTVDFLS